MDTVVRWIRGTIKDHTKHEKVLKFLSELTDVPDGQYWFARSTNRIPGFVATIKNGKLNGRILKLGYDTLDFNNIMVWNNIEGYFYG